MTIKEELKIELKQAYINYGKLEHKYSKLKEDYHSQHLYIDLMRTCFDIPNDWLEEKTTTIKKERRINGSK